MSIASGAEIRPTTEPQPAATPEHLGSLATAMGIVYAAGERGDRITGPDGIDVSYGWSAVTLPDKTVVNGFRIGTEVQGVTIYRDMEDRLGMLTDNVAENGKAWTQVLPREGELVRSWTENRTPGGLQATTRPVYAKLTDRRCTGLTQTLLSLQTTTETRIGPPDAEPAPSRRHAVVSAGRIATARA